MYGSREKQMPSRFVSEMGLSVPIQQLKTNYYDGDYDNYSMGYGNNYSTYSSYSSSRYASSNNDRYSSSTTFTNKQASQSASSYSTYDDYASKINTYDNKRMGGSGLNNLQNLMNSKLSTQKSKFAEYKVGVQVLHTKFGVGKIIKVDGGENNYVSIDFGTLGVKTLSLNFAPLQILK